MDKILGGDDERSCHVTVTVPSSDGSFSIVDNHVGHGNAPTIHLDGTDIHFQFYNNGQFSSAIRLKSASGNYLVVAASNPRVGYNKTKAYYGGDSSKTPESVWGSMYKWGECDGNIKKGDGIDRYDSPSKFSYKVV